jgi:membrane-bound metal-dependent hydrolase YbcI (DUF457 family)
MPSPIGHSLSGLVLYSLWSRVSKPGRESPRGNRILWAAAFVAFANIPDFDFLVLTRDGLEYNDLFHHGPSHSIGFAVLCGIVAFLAVAVRHGGRTGGKAFLVAFLGVTTHAVLDYFGIDEYPDNGIGLPLLFPFTQEYFIFPRAFFPIVHRDDPISWNNFLAVSFEVFSFLAVLGFLHRGILKRLLHGIPAGTEPGARRGRPRREAETTLNRE